MLTVSVPGKELYIEKTNEFVQVKPAVLKLEHSLLSISEWEAIWHKPYMSTENKTADELLSYIKCMTVSKNVDNMIYMCLTQKNIDDIFDYISNPMTATTFSGHQEASANQKVGEKIITSELVYYWMVQAGIPFRPAETWHINRLMTLIKIYAIKNSPKKKMSAGEIIRQNKGLNAERRRMLNSKG